MPVNRQLLQSMSDSLIHRGPDGSGTWVDDGVGLVHRRLAVLDEEGGKQPMRSRDGQVVLTYNGEIYNFKDLRNRLSEHGYNFQTRSDTEVLLAAYLHWGRDCVDHIWGMFAFAIWDGRSKCLFAARDRIGIKPFYWTIDSAGRFVFASEMKALTLNADLKRELRSDAVEDYLALGYVPDPKTILHGVHKLAPGHTLEIRKGEKYPHISRYWSVKIEPKVSRLESQNYFMEQLEGAVSLRMVADVPVGAFLSGGLDSSAIVAMMSRMASQPVETCTIVSEEGTADESGYAALVSDFFGTRHRLRFASEKDAPFLDMVPSLFDEPFADNSALPTYKVSALAREKVTVALSGDGADELFGGYARYRMHLAEQEIRALLPRNVRQLLFAPLARLYPKMDWAPRVLRAKSTLEGLSASAAKAYFNSVAKIPDRDRLPLLGADLKKALQGYRTSQLFEDLYEDVRDKHPLTQIQYIDLHTYLPGDILTKVDRTSMANALEVRVPFLDHRMVEYAFSIDPRAHVVRGRGKAVMYGALAGILPPEILERRKQGFTVPMQDWLKTAFTTDLDALMAKSPLFDMGLIDRPELEKKVAAHRAGRNNYETLLWSVLVLDRSVKRLNVSGMH